MAYIRTTPSPSICMNTTGTSMIIDHILLLLLLFDSILSINFICIAWRHCRANRRLSVYDWCPRVHCGARRDAAAGLRGDASKRRVAWSRGGPRSALRPASRDSPHGEHADPGRNGALAAAPQSAALALHRCPLHRGLRLMASREPVAPRAIVHNACTGTCYAFFL